MKKMEICAEQRRSPRRKLGVANPAIKRRPPLAELDTNVRLAFKHGMQLRSRSASPPSPVKKKPSPPPVIVRPDSPVDAVSSETIVLRPKLKSSPTKIQEDAVKLKSSPQPSPTKIQEDAIKLPDRQREYFPRSGFTVREYTICRHYMRKLDFEYEDPIPSEWKYTKDIMDQVRATKGYGVTMHCVGITPGLCNHGFTPLMGKLENDQKFRELVDEMIKMVLGAIQRKMRKKYTPRGVEKLVKSTRNYFLTLGVSDPTAKHQIVEALVYRLPMGSHKNFQLLEWKIKQGLEVVFCTVELLK